MDGRYVNAPFVEKKSTNLHNAGAPNINSKHDEFYPTAPQGQSSSSNQHGSNNTVINLPEYIINPAVNADGDTTDDAFKNFEFNEKSIRRAFVIKVYGIIMLQLAITLSFIAWFMCHEPTKLYVQRNLWVFIASVVFYFTSYIIMLLYEPARREVPINYGFLLTFTVSLSVMLGAACSTYEVTEVLTAFGITMVIVVALTIFACQTKWDFTMLNGSLFVIFLVILLFGLIAIITRSPTLYLLYCGLGVLFFSVFLVYDTQLIISGTHKYKISPEEYVFAALCIYLDIINIFIRILRLLRS